LGFSRNFFFLIPEIGFQHAAEPGFRTRCDFHAAFLGRMTPRPAARIRSMALPTISTSIATRTTADGTSSDGDSQGMRKGNFDQGPAMRHRGGEMRSPCLLRLLRKNPAHCRSARAETPGRRERLAGA